MGKKLKLAIIVADGIHAEGGIERIMLYLTREFQAHYPYIDFRIIRTRYGRSVLARYFSIPIALAQFFLNCLFRKIDVVHINVAPRGSTFRKMLFVWVARIFKKKIILHLHGSGYDSFFMKTTGLSKNLILSLFQSADAVIVLGSYWKDFVRSRLGVITERIHLVPNGVPEPAALADPTNLMPHIVFLGQVGRRKGVDVLLEAAGLLNARGCVFRLSIAGNGSVAEYQGISEQLGLAGNVQFSGWIDEEAVNLALLGSDIFVLPSRAENQPVSILEAMARSLPVVSSRIGAIPEQVEHGVTGLLVEPGDAEDLFNALSRLISDPSLRAEMGRAGRLRWEARYSISACARETAKVYSMVRDAGARSNLMVL